MARETSFLKRTGAACKKHSGTAIISTLLGALSGSVIPMLQDWHSEKQTSDAIAKVEFDCMKRIEQVNTDNQADILALAKRENEAETAMSKKGIVPNHH